MHLHGTCWKTLQEDCQCAIAQQVHQLDEITSTSDDESIAMALLITTHTGNYPCWHPGNYFVGVQPTGFAGIQATTFVSVQATSVVGFQAAVVEAMWCLLPESQVLRSARSLR